MIERFTTEWDFSLGEKVKDRVTGFKGAVVARIEYLNGCRQYCVEPKVDKEGKMNKASYIDERQLESTSGKPKKATEKKTEGPGGRMPNEPE